MVVPNYDDDEIIEDYEEVSGQEPASGVRRVVSGQGGPVQKPTKDVKPSDKIRPPTSANPRPKTQMNPALKSKAAAAPAGAEGDEANMSADELAAAHAGKGKITKQQAKLIWIICIAVCVLGVGAVGVHYFFLRDPGAAPPPVNNAPRNRPGLTGTNTGPAKSEHEQKADTFIRAVNGYDSLMGRSKAWDFFLVGQHNFGRAVEKALKLKKDGAPKDELESAWADAVKAWYEARYRINVFILVNRDESVRDFMTADLRSRESVLALTDADYANVKLQRYHAALEKVGRNSDNIKMFQTDVIKNDIQVGNMFTSDKWKPHWAAEKKKWDDSNPDLGDPQIEAADLEYCKGPDFLEGEKTGIQKATETDK